MERLRDERVLASEYKLMSLKESKLQKRIEQATSAIKSQKSNLYRVSEQPAGDVEGYYSRYFSKDALSSKEKSSRAKIRGQCLELQSNCKERREVLGQQQSLKASKNIRMSQSTGLLASASSLTKGKKRPSNAGEDLLQPNSKEYVKRILNSSQAHPGARRVTFEARKGRGKNQLQRPSEEMPQLEEKGMMSRNNSRPTASTMGLRSGEGFHQSTASRFGSGFKQKEQSLKALDQSILSKESHVPVDLLQYISSKESIAIERIEEKMEESQENEVIVANRRKMARFDNALKLREGKIIATVCRELKIFDLRDLEARVTVDEEVLKKTASHVNF
jgi:hypothetical protein